MENKYQEEGLLLQRQRAKFMLTQNEVSNLSKVQFRVYQRFEYGVRTIAISQMRTGLAVCAVLDIDPYELVFGMKKDEYMNLIIEERNKLYNH